MLLQRPAEGWWH